jgi:O-antigen ligase/thioredoxin-like negative regulator of GroEL
MFNLNRFFHQTIIVGLFALLFTPLIVSTPLFFPFITGKAFFFRIITEVVLVLWLWLAWRDPSYRPQRSWILWAVVALVAVSTLATIFSINPYRSFWSNYERMGGLISYLHLLAYFLVLGAIFRTEKIWHWFFNTSVIASSLVCFYGLTQLSSGRIEATLGNAAYLGGYLLLNIFLTLFLIVKTWSVSWTRWIYGLVILLQLFILYRTSTRGAMLGLLAGLFVSAVYLVVRRWSNRKIRTGGLVLLGVLVLLVGGFLLAKDSSFVRGSAVLSRFADISLKDATTDSRLTLWQMSLKGFVEHPILGWGAENYDTVFAKYYEAKLWRQEPWFDRSHNIFLDWLIDAGALGLLAYLALFATALYYLWHRGGLHDVLSQALFTGLLAAYLVNNFFVFDNLISYLFFFALLAYWHVAVNGFVDSKKVRFLAPAPFTSGDIAAGLVLTVVLVTGLYQLNLKPLQVSSRLIEALILGNSGQAPEEVAQGRIAIFRDIFSANTFGSREASEQLSNQISTIVASPDISVGTKQSAVDLLIGELQQQAAAAPDNTRTNFILGTGYINVGRPADAVRTITYAHELSPNKQLISFQLAAAKLLAGDKVGAVALAAETYHLDETYPEAKKFYALMLLEAGQIAEAQKLLEGVTDLASDDRFVNAYVALKRYDIVLKLWQERIAASPNDAQARFSLAAAYLLVNKRTEAIKELETASQLEPRAQDQVTELIKQIKAGKTVLQP